RAAEARRVGNGDFRPRAAQAEAFDRQAHRVLLADDASELFDLELLHGAASGSFTLDLRSGTITSAASFPRLRAMSSTLLSSLSAFPVARTTLGGFEDPMHLVRMSWIPALSTTARTAPPAMTPVPAEAGRKNTRPLPK